MTEVVLIYHKINRFIAFCDRIKTFRLYWASDDDRRPLVAWRTNVFGVCSIFVFFCFWFSVALLLFCHLEFAACLHLQATVVFSKIRKYKQSLIFNLLLRLSVKIWEILKITFKAKQTPQQKLFGHNLVQIQTGMWGRAGITRTRTRGILLKWSESNPRFPLW